MNKEYMLAVVRKRIAYLTKCYSAAVNNKTIDGRELTPNGAGSKRAKLKRDIQILILLQELLLKYTGSMIENEDACEAFDKLVEPRSCAPATYLEKERIDEED